MKKPRRLLALVLAIMVVVGLLTVPAAAYTSTSKCPTCGSTSITILNPYPGDPGPAETFYVESYGCYPGRHTHINYRYYYYCTCRSCAEKYIGLGDYAYTKCGATGNKVSFDAIA